MNLASDSGQSAGNVIVESNIISDNAEAGIVFGSLSQFKVSNNIVTNCTDGSAFYAGIQIQGTATDGDIGNNLVTNCLSGVNYSGTAGKLTIIGNNLVGNRTPFITSGTMTRVVVRSNIGFNPRGPLGYVGGNPSLPDSGVVYRNLYGYDCMVTVYGGTVSGILISASSNLWSTGLTSGAFIVPANGCIEITYSSTPTWAWYGL
jgi:parallel beta-helix repeat protein